MSETVCEIPGCDETDGSVAETRAVVEKSDYLDNNDRNEKLGPIQQSLDNLRKIITSQNDSDNSAVEIDDNPIKSICIENYKEMTNIDDGKSNELIKDAETGNSDRTVQLETIVTNKIAMVESVDKINSFVVEKAINKCFASDTESSENNSCTAQFESTPSSTEPVVQNVQPIRLEIETTDDLVISQLDPSQYRIKVEQKSDDSSSSSSEEEVDQDKSKTHVVQRSRQSSTSSQTDKQTKFTKEDIRTKGELFPEDLPPLEELIITVDECVNLVDIGNVVSIVGILVIVQSNQNMPPLNEETVVFLEGRVSCGKIFEVFGPVSSPWYSLRFNSTEDIANKGITVGTKMFCAPKVDKYTNFVFVEHLKQIKGSDASWEDNNEPPPKFMDFSDDEEEKRAKAKHRNKNQESNDGDQIPGAKNIRRKKQKQSNEPRTEQQTNKKFQENIIHTRHQEASQFSPFGGQHNKFQPRVPSSQNNQRFPSAQWNKGNFRNPDLFGSGPGSSGNINIGGQAFTRNILKTNPGNKGHTFLGNTASVCQMSGTNYNQVNNIGEQSIIPSDFSKPPPNFNFSSNMNVSNMNTNKNNTYMLAQQNSQRSNEFGQTWQETGDSLGNRNLNWQPNFSFSNTEAHTTYSSHSQGSVNAGSFERGSFPVNTGGRCFGDGENSSNYGNDLNMDHRARGQFSFNGSSTAKMNNTDNNSYSVSNSYSYSSNQEDFPSNWQSHVGPFQNTAQTNSEPLQSTTSAVENRYNMNYNSPSVRQPLPLQSYQPRFGGQPQFTRINRPY